jgi:hypothetical protein
MGMFLSRFKAENVTPETGAARVVLGPASSLPLSKR